MKSNKIQSCLRKYKKFINTKNLIFIGIENLTKTIVNEISKFKKIENIQKLEDNIRNTILAAYEKGKNN